MASAVRMLAAGLSLAGNTVALMVFALGGGAVFTRLTLWTSSIVYTTAPVIDPALMQWTYPLFFVMLLALEIVLIYATYQAVFARKVYYPEQGY